jgi:leucyl-tRNA synthetase
MVITGCYTTISNTLIGVFLGIYVIHPLTKEKIPVYTSEYVLPDYGTGVIMGVPAHDQRDYDFAIKHSLPIRTVIQNESSTEGCNSDAGVLINSNEYSGLKSEEASKKLVEYAKLNGFGGRDNYYKLRDWLISRQRYWGAPIPLIHCKSCSVVPVPYDQLPVVLPSDVKLTGRGSPLSKHPSFVNTKCPKCGGEAHRETDTMDTFVDSSWYFLRYPDASNSRAMFDSKITNPWLPVHAYIGGVEHAILHLLYSRFLTKVLNDQGFISVKEPFQNLLTQGTKNH